MKLKSTITLSTLLLAMAGTSLARTWTSADGKNTFEGEFVSATDTTVTVKRTSDSTTFLITRLSDQDQEYVKEAITQAKAEAEARAESEKLSSAAVPKAIGGKLVKLDGKSLKKAGDFDVVPKYYFLAYSASW